MTSFVRWAAGGGVPGALQKSASAGIGSSAPSELYPKPAEYCVVPAGRRMERRGGPGQYCVKPDGHCLDGRRMERRLGPGKYGVKPDGFGPECRRPERDLDLWRPCGHGRGREQKKETDRYQPSEKTKEESDE